MSLDAALDAAVLRGAAGALSPGPCRVRVGPGPPVHATGRRFVSAGALFFPVDPPGLAAVQVRQRRGGVGVGLPAALPLGRHLAVGERDTRRYAPPTLHRPDGARGQDGRGRGPSESLRAKLGSLPPALHAAPPVNLLKSARSSSTRAKHWLGHAPGEME